MRAAANANLLARTPRPVVDCRQLATRGSLLALRSAVRGEGTPTPGQPPHRSHSDHGRCGLPGTRILERYVPPGLLAPFVTERVPIRLFPVLGITPVEIGAMVGWVLKDRPQRPGREP